MDRKSGWLRLSQIIAMVRQVPPMLVATIVLSIGLAISALAWQVSRNDADRLAKAKIESIADLVTSSLQRRLLSQEQILRGSGALFNMNNDITRAQWRSYVSSLRLDENFPGIQGVGFSLHLSAKDVQKHIAQIRAEGFPEYSIHPFTPREQYHSILYLEPFSGRNLRAFGFDMSTEAVRRSALERARDTGEASLSGRVTLVQEGKDDTQNGFLLYIPVYRYGMPRSSVEERRAALLGYVYSPFRSADMMNSVLENNYPDVAIEVFDGQNATNQHRMFASHNQFQAASASLQVQRQIEFCGRIWTLRYSALPTFDVAIDARHSASVLVVGMVLTLLITLIVTNLASTRNRAFGMAKNMNRQLTRSESQLRTVLDSAADGILSVNPRGLVQSANQAAEHTFGTPPGMLEGKPLEYSIAGLDQARLVEVLGAHGSEDSTLHKARFEAIGLRASGEQFPLAVSLSEFWLDGEVHFSLMVRDISDEKMAEAILQLRLQAIESANNGIIISDMSLPGHPIIYANPAFSRITGYREDEVVGQNCKFLQGNEQHQPEIAELAAAIRAGEPCQVLLRNYKKDGSLFWNELAIAPVRNSHGKVTHYVGSQTDITDRVRAEENLLIRTKRLDSIFTLSPDGLVAFDAHGMLTNVNPAFLRMTGLEFAQLQGCSEAQFDHLMSALCDPAQAYPSLLEACQRAASSAPLAKQMLYLATPAKCILLRSLRVDEADSHEKVVYFRDITHEFEVDRIKSEFLSTAAHELRTPMASIYGFSELLLRRKYDEATQRELFGTINRQAGVLINLINELLDLARIEARAGKDFKYKTQSLAPVIASAVKALLVNNDTRQVQLEIPEDLPMVHIDAEKFSLALTNVLANAYKYSPGGGDITLSVVTRQHEGNCQLGVSVTDHGIGLSPEHLARLFERFFRADPSGNIPGTGLGMCLVKEIVELHNGSVQVASEVGQGTTVVLWLPAVALVQPLAQLAA